MPIPAQFPVHMLNVTYRAEVPVVDVLGTRGDLVVLIEDLGEERVEVVVVVRVHGVAAHSRVCVHETRSGNERKGVNKRENQKRSGPGKVGAGLGGRQRLT